MAIWRQPVGSTPVSIFDAAVGRHAPPLVRTSSCPGFRTPSCDDAGTLDFRLPESHRSVALCSNMPDRRVQWHAYATPDEFQVDTGCHGLALGTLLRGIGKVADKRVRTYYRPHRQVLHSDGVQGAEELAALERKRD
jgi:hypothetical protein